MATDQNAALPFAEDVCDSAAEIGDYIHKTERQATHLCATGQIPAWKEGGKWRMRKSRYLQHIADLEDAALGRRPSPQLQQPAASQQS
jgi:hypothetical protein